MTKASKLPTADGDSQSTVTSSTEAGEPAKSALTARVDTAALTITELATVILARQVRPRVGDVRRLAEAVLRKKSKKKKAGKKVRKVSNDVERKLSKIPARKPKK